MTHREEILERARGLLCDHRRGEIVASADPNRTTVQVLRCAECHEVFYEVGP